ncbi:MAG: cobalamin-binding protein [Candidatus Dormiibacterota bacterium]
MRVASLLPSATEILFAVGAGDDVVGVTHECDFPEGAQQLPVLTASAIDHDGKTCAAVDRHIKGAVHAGSSIYKLDEALLATLAPDLVLTQELCDVCAVSYGEVVHAVRRLPGIAEVLSLEPSSLGDICATVEVVGGALGREPAAGRVAAEMRSAIAAVAAQPRPAPASRVACIEWTDPIMVGGHWVPEMVELAGGEDPLGRRGAPSHYVDWEEIVAAAPDVMVLMPCGFDLARTLELAPDITQRRGFRDLPCARSGRVAAVDGSAFFNRPGPRIIDGLRLLAAIFRGQPGASLPPGAAWIRA